MLLCWLLLNGTVNFHYHQEVNYIFYAVCRLECHTCSRCDLMFYKLNPPYIFLRDYMELTNTYTPIYKFFRHTFNYAHFTHILFSIVFAVGYCIGREISKNYNVAGFTYWHLCYYVAILGLTLLPLHYLGVSMYLSLLVI